MGRPTASSKAPAKSKAPSKDKDTSSGPPPKKRTRVEATSGSHSGKGKQVASSFTGAQPQERATREYGIKSVPPYGRAFYRKCRTDSYLPDFAVDEHKLKSRYPKIWEKVHELGLGFVFKNPGEANLSLMREFCAGWNIEDKEKLVPIRGRLIDISATALCRFVDAPDVPCNPLCDFIDRPTYRNNRHTLCGVNSNVVWTRDKRYNTRTSLPKVKFTKIAKVWLCLVNARLLPYEHDSVVVRKRVCQVYFLMKWWPVNVGQLICSQMAKSRKGKLNRIFFVNMLTQYLRKEQVDEEPQFDMLLPPTSRATDITIIRWLDDEDDTTLTTSERQDRDESVLPHLYGMMDL
ncbi:hypothetical protein A4A49_31474 [Nicotiana attenuata]|uniref:Putative plant transposon protein domain-containing protein n=1 Tax=Nicotiana attenuata TaxID=49451 RepID=A0A1J6ILF2_NICAT|nr:hypothetical protein A4A49_31474 [Nicotiana attenuata]